MCSRLLFIGVFIGCNSLHLLLNFRQGSFAFIWGFFWILMNSLTCTIVFVRSSPKNILKSPKNPWRIPWETCVSFSEWMSWTSFNFRGSRKFFESSHIRSRESRRIPHADPTESLPRFRVDRKGSATQHHSRRTSVNNKCSVSAGLEQLHETTQREASPVGGQCQGCACSTAPRGKRIIRVTRRGKAPCVFYMHG